MGRFTDIAKTLNVYFNQFGAAYLENNVPGNATRPYITYSLSDTDEFEDGLMQVKVYDNSTSILKVSEITDNIGESLGYGVLVPAEKGNIYLRKGSPYAQYINEDNTELSVYINIIYKIL